MSDTYFDFPVRIASKPGHDTMVAVCHGCRASSTSSATFAMKAMVSCGKPATYEFSPVEQHGKRVRVAFRQKESEVAA